MGKVEQLVRIDCVGILRWFNPCCSFAGVV